MSERTKDSGFFSLMQRIGRSFMLPIALLPVAGLLLGVGASFTNAAALETYGLTEIMGEGTALYTVFSVLSAVGVELIDHLVFVDGDMVSMNQSQKGNKRPVYQLL